MKIFSWVQNKLTSKKSDSNIPANHHIQPPCKEEFSDWPHGLLAIGTFGNKIKQETEKASQDHLHGVTPEEEVGKLQIELIFPEHVGRPTSHEERNCSTVACSDDDSNNKTDHDDLHCSTSLVHIRAKDMCLDSPGGGAIGKKSLSFLLKKMFVCASGFSPAPSLRDPIMESRMEKMLRTILHKKIYPQNSTTQKLSSKNYLESHMHIPKTANRDGKVEKADDGSKWVKTDSEYIRSKCNDIVADQSRCYNGFGCTKFLNQYLGEN